MSITLVVVVLVLLSAAAGGFYFLYLKPNQSNTEPSRDDVFPYNEDTCKQLGMDTSSEVCTESNIRKTIHSICDEIGLGQRPTDCNPTKITKFREKCQSYDLMDNCNTQSVGNLEQHCKTWDVSPCTTVAVAEKLKDCENLGIDQANCHPKALADLKQRCTKEGLAETCTKADIKRKNDDIECRKRGLADGCSKEDIDAKLKSEGKSTDVCVRVWGLQPGCSTGEKLGLKPGYSNSEFRAAAESVCKSIGVPWDPSRCSPGDAVGILGTCKDLGVEPCVWETIKPKLNPGANY